MVCAAAVLADQLRGSFKRGGGARGERDVGAVAGEGQGHAEAEALAAAVTSATGHPAGSWASGIRRRGDGLGSS